MGWMGLPPAVIQTSTCRGPAEGNVESVFQARHPVTVATAWYRTRVAGGSVRVGAPSTVGAMTWRI